MCKNLVTLRDDCRSHLANRPGSQIELAAKIGIPYSWLNKFINGAFKNPRLDRFEKVRAFVESDRKHR